MMALIGLLIAGAVMTIGGSVGADRTDDYSHEAIHGSLIALTVVGWALISVVLIAILGLIIQEAYT